jgi:hypothetical protein
VANGIAATLALLQKKGQLNDSEKLSGRANDERPEDRKTLNKDGGVRLEHRDDFGNLLTPKQGKA